MSNTITLNIGLKTNNGDELSAGLALQKLYDCVLERFANPAMPVSSLKIADSTTERTLVVSFEPKEGARKPARDTDLYIALYELSVALSQDCIAVYYAASQHGDLVGPRAEGWGAFDPKEFIF